MTDILSYIWPHAPEIGVILGGAVATYVAKTKGLITFGRSRDRRSCPSKVIGAVKGMCDDHKSVITAIKSHEEGSARREKKIDDLAEKVDEVCSSVSKIVGFLQGRNGYHE